MILNKEKWEQNYMFIICPFHIWLDINISSLSLPWREARIDIFSQRLCPSLQGRHVSKVWHKKNKRFSIFLDLIFWSGLPEIFPRKKSLKADVVRVAVDGGFVWAGLNLLWLLRGERILSTVPDVHLQLWQYLEGGLELCLTAEAKEEWGLI